MLRASLPPEDRRSLSLLRDDNQDLIIPNVFIPNMLSFRSQASGIFCHPEVKRGILIRLILSALARQIHQKHPHFMTNQRIKIPHQKESSLIIIAWTRMLTMKTKKPMQPSWNAFCLSLHVINT
uniref:Uncharacterized protein n=1 Tax=Candidatus Kentrum sp. MB TaxID=2138164 RepID=A0A450XIB8_9GAMM|nr:MAG: hypothetical protein BECKMB1821I_GA0114274_100814 [Candidatus Kentron sp. MB]VFK74655.1 MAG: hypothetical protein BECKMB1821H_GA0114242_100814 [Candidatus Kentron sp. MB]